MSKATVYLKAYPRNKRLHAELCQCLHILTLYQWYLSESNNDGNSTADLDKCARAGADLSELIEWWNQARDRLLEFAGVNELAPDTLIQLTNITRLISGPERQHCELPVLEIAIGVLYKDVQARYDCLKTEGISALGIWGFYFLNKLDDVDSTWSEDVCWPRQQDVESGHWPFVMTPIQVKIVDALTDSDGPLTTSKLAAATGLESCRLYRHGDLQDLMNAGIVMNKKRRGYYLSAAYASKASFLQPR